MSDQMKSYAYLAAMLGAVYAYSMFANLLYPLFDLTAELDIYVFNKWLLVLLIAIALLFLGLMRDAGVVARANWRTLPLYWPLFAMAGLTWAATNGTPGTELVVKTVTFCIAVGLSEEVMFRGLLFHWFRARPVRQIILISAASFAFIHFAVGLSSEFPIEVIAGQAVLAFALGLIFAAARARDASIWIPVIMHAGLDIAVVLAQGGISQTLDAEAQSAAGFLVVVVFILAWGLWLLWRAEASLRETESHAGDAHVRSA